MIDPNGSCQVTPRATITAINVRSGPGTNYNIVGQLASGTTGLVIGRLPDNSWFQVNVNGMLGWVSATVVIVGGNCSGVSVVVPPTVAPPAATEDLGATATQFVNQQLTATARRRTASTRPRRRRSISS